MKKMKKIFEKKSAFLILGLTGVFSLLGSEFFAQNSTPSATPETEGMEMCGGVERWAVKVLTDPAVNTINFTPINTTIATLVAMSTPAPSTTMPRFAGVEDKTYVITCNITIKKAESDADFHLVLSDGVRTMIGEIPDPACATASTSAYVNNFITCRNWVNAHIASGNVFNVNIPPVTIKGVAFVDPPHGQTGAAPNNMELHSILDIHFATTTGLQDNDSKILDVVVGPNPFSSSTHFDITSKLNDLGVCSLVLFDIRGEEVKEVTLPVTANNKIDYTLMKDDLAPGIYLYRIKNSGTPLYEGKLVVTN